MGPVARARALLYIGRDKAIGHGTLSQTGEEYAEQLEYVAAGRAKARSLKPLRQLVPFLKPYRLAIGVAIVALICSSTASLLIPPALGKLVQNGFSQHLATQIDQYFLPLVGIALALAVATAIRFYFVT